MIYDALIVGGGPAGAATALLLAQAGWNVAIVEKKIFPRRKVCGEFISATSLPLLQRLGIADFYQTNAGPEIHQVGLFAGDAELVSCMPKAYHSSNHWGRALGREHLDTLLLDRAVSLGAERFQPCNVKSFQRNANSFITTIESDNGTQHLSSRLLIAAHGSWERGIEADNNRVHKPSNLLAFKAHFSNTSLLPGLMPLIAFPGGYGGLVHTDNGRITLSCCIRRDKLQAARLQYPDLSAGDAVLQHITATCLGARNVFTHAERVGSWLSAGPIRPGVRQCINNGVLYVGNIAGEAHPVVAEGISMAMQSAWVLAQTLLASPNKEVEEIGLSYKKHWNTGFANRIHIAALFAHFAMRPWAVGSVLPIIKQFPGLLTWGAKLSGKIKQVVPAICAESTSSEMGNTI